MKSEWLISLSFWKEIIVLVDTAFPLKWVTYCIPFGVHVYILETHSSYTKAPLLKLHTEIVSISLNIDA